MAGLDTAILAFLFDGSKDVDARRKAGHDGYNNYPNASSSNCFNCARCFDAWPTAVAADAGRVA